jgi:hypothetical protein
MRRLRDIIQGHVADAGGIDLLSTAEQSILRRASVLEIELEMMESRFAGNDGAASADQIMLYAQTANSTRRLLESVGLKRRPRLVPNLDEYLAGSARARRGRSRSAEEAVI